MDSVARAGRRSAPTARSPLGAVLAELRAAGLAGAPVAAARRAARGRPQPELRLEACGLAERPPGPLAVRWLLPASVGAHILAVTGLLVGPLLRADALPPPATAVRAFFVAPVMAGPPPPPPAAPRLTAARSRPVRPVRANAVAGPALVPAAEVAPVAAPEPLDLDPRAVEPETLAAAAAGTEGGAAGGVPGGVVGGVIGGLPERETPPQPVRVGGAIQEPAKVKHVPPAYPDIAVRSNVQGAVVLECTISPQGRVAAVKLIQGIPLLNEAAVAAVRQWVYTPTLRDGVPVSIIMTVTVRFGLEERRRT
jgi:protein TonB